MPKTVIAVLITFVFTLLLTSSAFLFYFQKMKTQTRPIPAQPVTQINTSPKQPLYITPTASKPRIVYNSDIDKKAHYQDPNIGIQFDIELDMEVSEMGGGLMVNPKDATKGYMTIRHQPKEILDAELAKLATTEAEARSTNQPLLVNKKELVYPGNSIPMTQYLLRFFEASGTKESLQTVIYGPKYSYLIVEKDFPLVASDIFYSSFSFLETTPAEE